MDVGEKFRSRRRSVFVSLGYWMGSEEDGRLDQRVAPSFCGGSLGGWKPSAKSEFSVATSASNLEAF